MYTPRYFDEGEFHKLTEVDLHKKYCKYSMLRLRG